MHYKKPFVLGLVTARGGSIRLPKKNSKIFCGHPLLAWSIMQLRCSRLINEVVLTTDNEEMAEIGRRYGARIIMRPVLDDDITAGYVFKLAIEQLEKEGMKIDEIVCCLPTSPLKKPNDIDDLIGSYHTIRIHENAQEMGTYSPNRECFIFENCMDMTTVYNKPYYLKCTIANKGWNYSVMGGGWGIAQRDYLMDVWTKNSIYDSEIDKSLKEIIGKDSNEILGYSIEPWQCFETDYEVYFKICEVLMEEFILKGNGMNIYTRYAREFRKIVNWEEESDQQQQLDLSKYIGNSNQIVPLPFDGD